MYMDEFLDDEMHEECGVFGIYAPNNDVAQLTYYGLFSLQHRGQEGCGIAVDNGDGIEYYKRLGLVTDVFNDDILKSLPGNLAIGHVRYSTTGNNSEINTQPLVAKYLQGDIAVAHNGNLVNIKALKQQLAGNGSVFQTTTDTEVIINLLARYGHNSFEDALLKVMLDLKGSYALVALNNGKLYAARDPYGNRPLCIGTYGDGYVVASESCAFDTIGATFLRDVAPGEVLTIDENGLHSYQQMRSKQLAQCIFEYVYFARPDSTIDGINVNRSRRLMGEILAAEIGALDVDVVISVPDSGTTSALGYADASGIPFTQGILKNRYTSRSFIQPTQAMRERMVGLKLNPIREELEGKRVAVVDDSIVRGTTSKRLVERLRERGAAEIHFLVVCPPVTHPCYYGIDTADRDKLIAVRMDTAGICEYIGADSLHYLSLDGLLEAVGGEQKFCTACLNGEYRLGTLDS